MIVLTLVCVIIIDNFQRVRDEKKISIAQKKENETAEGNHQEPDESGQESNYVTFVALGQNYMNDSVIHSGQSEDGTSNYDFMFSGLSSYLQSADIAALCPGSVIGGNALGVSGYPTFNSPEEVCDAAVAAGIDVVAMANIRVNSMGSTAISSCLNIWKSKSDALKVLGIHDSPDDTSIPIMEVNGLKIALLDYTAVISDALNDDEVYKVNFLGRYSGGQADLSVLSEKTLAEIDAANKSSDFVIVFASWGLDDTHDITATQQRFAQQLTEAGADLIIGYRPNNLQKVEWITAENGNRALCYYSLGNFISSENTQGALIGGMAKVGIKVENGLTVIDEENTGLVPIVTQYSYSGTGDEVDVTATIPFSAYTDEMAASHGITTKYGVAFDRASIENIIHSTVDASFLLEE